MPTWHSDAAATPARNTREVLASASRCAKKTPILSFRPDMVIRSAERIDTILRADRERDQYRSPEATD